MVAMPLVVCSFDFDCLIDMFEFLDSYPSLVALGMISDNQHNENVEMCSSVLKKNY